MTESLLKMAETHDPSADEDGMEIGCLIGANQLGITMTERERRFAELDERIKNRPPKHPRWDELHWAVGYVDHNGAVHGKLIFADDVKKGHMHGDLFPKVKYKTWRWNKSQGMFKTLAVVALDAEDCEAVKNWLLKNGCLNDWEL